VLHLGNSSIARYFNFFPRQVNLYGNRGISGIDGSLSTAIGAALADSDRMHTLIIGDQSFLYDHNGFYAQVLPQNLRVFVLNNGVGGIFDWLPGTATTGYKARSIFANVQKVDLSGLAKAFGIAYKEVFTKEGLNDVLKFSQGIQLINCITEQEKNLTALNILQNGIA
jgi:2-succinyl-5-enolpyruvyl-6-hydroxy-3-cyclohexene-1-carboxylate synthase